jgi:hypothetical protein
VAGNATAGTVGLKFPLSSDFSNDTGVQLNSVSNSEVIQNVSISGITFNTHSEAILGAQMLNLQIFKCRFIYSGSSGNTNIFQFNQERNSLFFDNIVENITGLSFDPERNPTGWSIHDNVLYGAANLGEWGAGNTYSNNLIYCNNSSPLNLCLGASSMTSTVFSGNTVVWTGNNAGAALTDCYGAPSPGTIISHNTIISSGTGIRAETFGTVIDGNIIYSPTTGIESTAGGVVISNTSCFLTAHNPVGCVLVDGADHSDIIQGLQASGVNGVTGWSAVWVSDDGAQTTPSLTINGVTGTHLTYGIVIQNGAHDAVSINNAVFGSGVTAYLYNPGYPIAGTSGTTYCTQSAQGLMKVVSCELSSYSQTGAAQTWTYPTPFAAYPTLMLNSSGSTGSCGAYNPTTTTTTLTLPANQSMTAETCNVVLIGQ